jgi:hypothetical protein
MANLTDYFSAAQIERAHAMARDSIGRHCKVRTDYGLQHGVIVDCKPSHAGFAGRSVHVVWSVDLECGANKTLRNFKLRTLPGAR